MEINDDLEIRLLVTARKIRQLNKHLAALKAMDAPANIPASEQMRDELEREFQWLSEQIRATVFIAS